MGEEGLGGEGLATGVVASAIHVPELAHGSLKRPCPAALRYNGGMPRRKGSSQRDESERTEDAGTSRDPSPPPSDGRCELCGRSGTELQKHHLIPRTRHSNRRNKRQFNREEVRSRLAWLCPACHKTVHATLDEKDLEREYNTLDALRGHPEIGRFIAWVRRQPPGGKVTVRRPRERRDRGR